MSELYNDSIILNKNNLIYKDEEEKEIHQLNYKLIQQENAYLKARIEILERELSAVLKILSPNRVYSADEIYDLMEAHCITIFGRQGRKGDTKARQEALLLHPYFKLDDGGIALSHMAILEKHRLSFQS